MCDQEQDDQVFSFNSNYWISVYINLIQDMTESVTFISSQESLCLLQFVKTFQNSHTISTLQDVLYSSFLSVILRELDNELYKDIPDSLDKMEAYWQINRFVLKNVTTGVIIINSPSTEEIISKLLYICVHSASKDQYIEKILSLHGDIQTILMRLIEKVENELGIVKETQLILDKICDLQQANQDLSIKLQREKDDNIKTKETILLVNKQARNLEDECEKYRKEKAETLRELQIDQLSGYITMFRKVQRENHEFLDRIKNLETRINSTLDENRNLKQKIIQDNQILDKYHSQSTEMKSSLQRLNSLKRKTLNDQANDQSVAQSYIGIVNELQEHLVQEKDRHVKQLSEYQSQTGLLAKQNGDLKRLVRHLSSQMGQLEKIYKEMKEHVSV